MNWLGLKHPIKNNLNENNKMVLKKYRWWKDWDLRLLNEMDSRDAKIEEIEKQIKQVKDKFDTWFGVHDLLRPTISRKDERKIFEKVEGGGEEEEIE